MSSWAIVDEPTHHQRTHDEGPARSDSGRGGERPSGGRCSRAGRAGRLAGGDGWSSAASSSQMYEFVGDSRRTHTSPTNPRRGASAQRLRARRRAAQRRPVQPSWEGGAAELGGRGSRAGRAGAAGGRGRLVVGREFVADVGVRQPSSTNPHITNEPTTRGPACSASPGRGGKRPSGGRAAKREGGGGWCSAASSSQMCGFVGDSRRTHRSSTNSRGGLGRSGPAGRSDEGVGW